MAVVAVFIDMAVEGDPLKLHPAVVGLDGLFQIVDIDQLDMKLVVEMLHGLQLLLAEGQTGFLAEAGFIVIQFFAVLAEFFAPCIAFGGKLEDVYLNHGNLFLPD